MKKAFAGMAVFILMAGLACFAGGQETLEQLIARAGSSQPGQQPDLYMQVAERELRLTIDSFKAGQDEAARSSLESIVEYADKARAAALSSGKRLKHTEIKMRQLALRLRDLKPNVEVDDQGKVQASVDRLEDFRTQLLQAMFGSKKSD